MIKRIEEAVAKMLECDIEEVTIENYDFYGLAVFSFCGQEWAVGTDEEAHEAVREIIKNSVWSFRAEFIALHTRAGASSGMVKAITALQEDCEDCNDDILSLIENIDSFIEDAISADGRGMFISSYDNEEVETEVNGFTFYAYRLN
jgi:hypothetical protein